MVIDICRRPLAWLSVNQGWGIASARDDFVGRLFFKFSNALGKVTR